MPRRLQNALLVLLLLLIAGRWWWGYRADHAWQIDLPKFKADVGSAHQRTVLPYRIVSFHKGRADKNLIQLAANLGFNGVQFQIEGSNELGVADFAARDAQEHTIDFAHSLGMKVTVWVHEFSDLPLEYAPDYLGEPTIENTALWDAIGQRYEWMLTRAIPNVDGLVLTVVETQVRVTSPGLLNKLVSVIHERCAAHGKELTVRTFVWHPEELAGVIKAVGNMSSDIVVMSKAVPQDWQMRGIDAAEIGAFAGHKQIVEFDAAGEYFLKDQVANCMPALLAGQLDRAARPKAQAGVEAAKSRRPIDGICVRVDRDDYSILYQPQEVNLWALGLLASDAAADVDDVWNKYAVAHYGASAAPGVIKALKPTGDVVAEALSVGNFSDGDTRVNPPAMPDDPFFDKNWQNWRWDDKFLPELQKATKGDPKYLEQVMADKQKALVKAKQCIADLEATQSQLDANEYQILHTKLLGNQAQLQFRTYGVSASLHFRQLLSADTTTQANGILSLYRKDLANIRQLAADVAKFPPAQDLQLHGRTYRVGPPPGITADMLTKWAGDAEKMLNYYW